MTSSARPAPAVVPRAVIAGHGDFAAGIISAVQVIAGKGEVFRGVSNRDMGPVELEELIREAVAAVDAKVVFTDLPAGSCTVAARRVARDTPALVVVTGTNLSVLLAWVFAPHGATACDNAVERGHRAMAVFPGGAVQEGGGAA